MSENTFENDIKKSFEEEFDANDIFVSEDLIARTMAAIRKEENGSSDSNETEIKTVTGDDIKNNTESKAENDTDKSDKIVDISSRTKKNTMIKMVSGIAAALLIGIAGLFIFKIGNANKKESASDSMKINYATNNEQSSMFDEIKSVEGTNTYGESSNANQGKRTESVKSDTMEAAEAAPECADDSPMEAPCSEEVGEYDDAAVIDREPAEIYSNNSGSFDEKQTLTAEHTKDSSFGGDGIATVTLNYEEIVKSELDRIKKELDLQEGEDITKIENFEDKVLNSTGYNNLMNSISDLADTITEMSTNTEDTTDKTLLKIIIAHIENEN